MGILLMLEEGDNVADDIVALDDVKVALECVSIGLDVLYIFLEEYIKVVFNIILCFSGNIGGDLNPMVAVFFVHFQEEYRFLKCPNSSIAGYLAGAI